MESEPRETGSRMLTVQEQVLALVFKNADDDTLRAVALSSMSEQLMNQVKNPYFWYERILHTLVNFEFEFIPGVNWKYAYELLSEVLENDAVLEPFSAISPVNNVKREYSDVVVNLLLRMGYDPSVDDNETLKIAAMRASVETIQKLLQHPRVEPSDSEWKIVMLRASTRWTGVLEAFIVLAADPRTNKWELWFEALKRLARRHDVGNLPPFKFILEGVASKTPSWNLNELFWNSCRSSKTDVLKYLLTRSDVDVNYVANYLRSTGLLIAIEDKNTEVVKLLIADPRVMTDLTTWMKVTRLLIQDRDMDAIQTLVQRRSVTPVNVLELAVRIDNGSFSSEVLNAYPDIDMDDIQPTSRGLLIKQLATLGLLHIDCVALASRGLYTSEDISGILTDEHGYDHVESLLRELMFKSFDLSHYLDYLITLCKSKPDNKGTDIVARAAASILSTEPVVHTSSQFTAFSGFLLLTNDRDVEAIMNLLESEAGVTETGLQLAGMLLGAFTCVERQ